MIFRYLITGKIDFTIRKLNYEKRAYPHAIKRTGFNAIFPSKRLLNFYYTFHPIAINLKVVL